MTAFDSETIEEYYLQYGTQPVDMQATSNVGVIFQKPNRQRHRIVGRGPVLSGMNRPGRNDPCPCGSGEKFKRCHGV